MSVWDDIKDRLSVEEVIADYIPLVSAGANYKAVCPFHQEKSPSLMISPSKGIWHCFGCGEGGDIFAFVSQIENIEKQETLKRLAKKAGVQLKSYDKSRQTDRLYNTADQEASTPTIEQSEFEQGLKMLDWTAGLYHKFLLMILQDFKHPLTIYCRERNLTQEIINTFKIGYAPKTNTILNLASKHNLDKELLLSTGILKSNDKGLSDKFKDRLMIPIESVDGAIVGFTARVLPGDTLDRPKYLNSSQSSWFNKSELWFGLNHARGSIIRQKNAIIVEGNMDVVSCHQAGLTTTIASQGTSFTESQLKILKRMTRRVSLAFDNDEAGIIASKKFFIQATKIGLRVDRVVVPAEFKDIDEYISSVSKNETSRSERGILNIEAIPFIQWYISIKTSLLRSGDMNIQRAAIEDCIEVISVMDTLAQEQALKMLSSSTSLTLATLQSLIKKTTNKQPVLMDEQESEVNQTTKTVNPLVSSWKNTIALRRGDANQKPFLEKLYSLIKDIFPTIGSFDSLDEYYAEFGSELEYIAEELKGKGADRDDVYSRSLSQLMIELDKEVFVLSLQPEVLEKYIEIKQALTKS